MIGHMRHRLEVQRPRTPPEPDSFGGQPVEPWETLYVRWGQIEPVTGRELQRAGKTEADVSHTIRMRHDADLTPKHRLRERDSGRVFNIDSITNPGEKRYRTEMVVMVKEEV